MNEQNLENLFFSKLKEPFPVKWVRWKPAVVQGNRALALAYVSARVIQERLDRVMGPENWKDDYEVLSNNSVMCRLSLRINGEWVSKADVGGPSEQPDDGDRLKAAFSDALKRAAVKWQVGRYLYALPTQWCNYDQQSRRFTDNPTLPSWAMPKSITKQVEQKKSDEFATTNGVRNTVIPAKRNHIEQKILSEEEESAIMSDLKFLDMNFDNIREWLVSGGLRENVQLTNLHQLNRSQVKALCDGIYKLKSDVPF